MALRFRRRRGAVADVKELEYIIALHQTCHPDTRENATVSSLDVYRLLKSRYGMNATFFKHQDAAAIVRALGGGDNTMASDDMVEKVHAKRKKRGIFGRMKKSSGEENDEFFDAIDGSEETTDSPPQKQLSHCANVSRRRSPPSSPAESANGDKDAQPDGTEEYLE